MMNVGSVRVGVRSTRVKMAFSTWRVGSTYPDRARSQTPLDAKVVLVVVVAVVDKDLPVGPVWVRAGVETETGETGETGERGSGARVEEPDRLEHRLEVRRRNGGSSEPHWRYRCWVREILVGYIIPMDHSRVRA